MCIAVKQRIDLNKPIRSYIYCIGTNTPRCCGIEVHLRHSSWWSSQSPALLLERAQTESHFHEPLQLGEVGGLGPRCRSSRRLSSHIPETEQWLSVAGGRFCNASWNLTKWASCWPPLWGSVAGRNRSSPCSCAPPDTRPAPSRRTSRLLPWLSRKGMERSERRGRKKDK